ncbi:TonB-dependent receptor [Marixanthomonas sp. SCSIO 43207]|uniref:TonB-dependent receptor family protein n=1 Tax=Marixanthomonas sp. SCSIO 43207 TaxID=2779360 RepID=UPI001CA88B33|nr:TonB-dependent receptor [Marixanthomonas sp. SCSIO 43207]UAB80898.1 TonB-dependent receptor [Marixanthomonas sp. SCSIO 43207]
MQIKHILTVIFIAVFFNSSAQITGIISSEDNQPIRDVAVIVADSLPIYTNAKGVFTISSEIKLPVNLVLKHPDYYTETTVLSKNNETFILKKIESTEQLKPVILASTYQKESGVLIPTTQITSETFDNYDPVDLVSAINETPGVFIQQGAINTNRITIRGVGSRTLYGTNKIRAYFNGIPITNGVGETAIDSYNANDIANIEIIKGPKATQYGTNLGGTLLINSKELSKNGIETSNTLTLGSYGLFKNSWSTSIKDDKISFHFNYDHLQTDGYRDNSAYNRNNYFLHTKYEINSSYSIGLLVNHVNNNAQIPSSLGLTDFTENPEQAAFTWDASKGYEDNRQTLIGLSFSSRFSETFSNTTSVYYTYLDHYEPRPFNILDELTNGYGARTVFAKEFSINNQRASLTFGGEWYQDAYRWKTIENRYEENNNQGSLEGDLLSKNREERKSFSAFATTKLPITTKLKAEVGLNVNKTTYDSINIFNSANSTTSADRDFDVIFSPNLNLLYTLSPTTFFFGNISRGFNYPSLEETLTPEGIINPEIGPETGWNYELGTELYFFDRNLYLQSSVYLLSISNLLVVERVGNDQFIGRNAGKTHHRGIELQATYSFSINSQFEIKPFTTAEFNFHKFIDFVDGADDFSGNELTGVPDKKIAAGVTIKHNSGIGLTSNYRYIGSQPMTDTNSLYSDSYSVLNIQAEYKKAIADAFSIRLLAGINNVTNSMYASSILINASGFNGSEPRFYYPGLPRNYYSSLQLVYAF